MKKALFTVALAFAAVAIQAKDIKTVVFTTNPQMHCENCENKIKGNLKFETGIKEITTSVEKQTVTIQYDADKTSEAKLAEAFTKFGYKATKTGAQSEKQGACCKEGEKKACCKEANKDGESCCQQKATVKKLNKVKAGQTISRKKQTKTSELKAAKLKPAKATKAKVKTDATTSATSMK